MGIDRVYKLFETMHRSFLFAIFILLTFGIDQGNAQDRNHTYKCEKGEFTLIRPQYGPNELILNGKSYPLLSSNEGSINHYFNTKSGYYVQLWREPSLSRLGVEVLGKCSY